MADIVTRGRPATAQENHAIDSVLSAETGHRAHDGTGGRRARRHLLLPTLHAVNDRVGWISPEAIDAIAERLDVSPAEIYGVTTFYALFSTTERPAHQTHVCVDLACRAQGGPRDDLPDGTHPAPCLGLCEQAPAAYVTVAGAPADRRPAGSTTADELRGLAGGGTPPPEVDPAASVPQAGDPSLVLLRRAGRSDPLDLDAYVADGGFEALHAAREMGPEAVVEAVGNSGLTGRGGAAFPTGRKWEAVRTQPATPHYLVCNADESEPGTFKDRTLIENDPYALVESMCIAALATGCEHGYIYLRGEYPRAEQMLETAIARCRDVGHLGSGFEITIVRGAGAYICGEETAIFNSIEGYRGEPRNKPPFPFEVGLFGKPTVVNNVETLMNVPPIIRDRAAANRRLFCLSGAVVRPGVYEVELGLTLGELIDLAGGLRTGAELQAVLLGGAAGGFAGPADLDLVLDHESTRAAGLTLGSGVVMVHDQHVDLVDQIRRIAAFFRDESCGQCVPCRVGTVRQEEAVERLAAGARDGDIDLLRDIGAAMQDASICGLGQTAFNAIETAIDRLGVFADG
ncbi:MAG: NADH-ubiquinone oxidoreductase-F iron-sulfur binding region domain-containing protein [Ilumatobacter sp.]|uniref:NADH-ubiquinone oxidoreductase-F iron-sulfur binding region domain-containing protein n=1 Tax=Ilumatobacter sp. TaxID=1967498 RepID=UPI002608FDF3|nr:NADH-ubiquinone oxidoreductase-F iron-sulfur binding region domain-containing protein [Ilumatobacter sp.]MDJ0769094.1 NADH-ubiquinone oxidoreductase-F iron-sulfur binding region domain-containing protein [Ilumatobacter sp.]